MTKDDWEGCRQAGYCIGAAVGIGGSWYFTYAFDNKVQLIPWADTKGVDIDASKFW
jgi:hypothetical protein